MLNSYIDIVTVIDCKRVNNNQQFCEQYQKTRKRSKKVPGTTQFGWCLALRTFDFKRMFITLNFVFILNKKKIKHLHHSIKLVIVKNQPTGMLGGFINNRKNANARRNKSQ